MESSAVESITARRQEMVDIGNLQPSKYNSYEITDIKDMMATLMSVGLLTPLTVVGPFPDGKYTIISGERRYTGMKKCSEADDYDGRFDQVPCYVIHDCNADQTIQELELEIANLETRDPADKDKHRFRLVQILKQMATEGKIKEKEIVSIMGRCMKESNRYKRMYVAIFDKGSEGTKDLVLKKQISITEGSTISQLPPQTQEIVVDAINKGIPKAEVLEAVKETSREVREAKKLLKEKEKEENSNKDAATEEKEKTGGGIFKPKTAICNPEMDEIRGAVDNYDQNIFKDSDDDDEDDYIDYNEDNDPEEEYIKIRKIASGEKQRRDMEDFLNSRPDNIILSTPGTRKSGNAVTAGGNKTLEKVNDWVDSIFKKKEFSDNELETFERLREMLDYVDGAIVAVAYEE